jgi:hypothetical protein
MSENAPNQAAVDVEKAINNPEIPNLYANGFITATGNGDALVVLQQNGKSIATLNLSYTMAKTLTLKLGHLVKDLENKTGNTIMTTSDIDIALLNAEKDKNDES